MNRKWLFFDRLSNRFSLLIRGIEFLLAGMLVLFAVVSAVNLFVSAMADLNRIDVLFDYEHFQALLSFLLLLMISLELAIMLVKHNPNNVLEVMVYAIARKLLIANTSALDILISVIAMLLLFALRIYLEKGKRLPNVIPATAQKAEQKAKPKEPDETP